MTIQQALHMMAGRTDLVALRPEGELLILTRNCAIKSIAGGTPVTWWATFGAIVADNWQVVDVLKLKQIMAERAGPGA